MADMERIAADLRAAIAQLQARQGSLTRLERLKLASLLLNLDRVLAAKTRPETCQNKNGDANGDCTCALCESS